MVTIVERIFGYEGELSDGVVQDIYENTGTEIDYSPERAVRVGKKASEYVEFDEQGALSIHSNFFTMDSSSKRSLKDTFGDMLFEDDRKNRETPKIIESGELTYEEIGAATIGAGLAAAKVDEVGHTPYTPGYGTFFATVVQGNWNMNPDVLSDFQEETGHYQEIVQETAETVERQLLEIRPETDIEAIDHALEENDDTREKELEKEK